MMNVLVTDVDGVLNSHQSYFRTYRLKLDDLSKYHNELQMRLASDICPIAMSNLLFITEKVPDLRIVLSSNWRNDYPLDTLRAFFFELGLPMDKIIDKTPTLKSCTRSQEIQAWLDASYGLVAQYVVLDDSFIDSSLNFIQTDPRTGLTYFEAIEVIQHFDAEFEPPFLTL